MNLEWFVAQRLYGHRHEGSKVSRPAVVIALTGVALGLVVMLVTLCVSLGFKHEVREKAIGFGSHLHISNYDASLSYEAQPIAADDSLILQLQQMPAVDNVARYTTKPGILRTNDDFLGFVLKGVGPEYDLSFYRQYLCEGELPQTADSVKAHEILVSRYMADKLHLSVGDKLDTYFIQGSVRARRFTISGIYETGFIDYDKLFAVTDLATVQRLNHWHPDQVTGIEIKLHDYAMLDEQNTLLSAQLDGTNDKYGGRYYVQTIEDINLSLFSWLKVLDVNVWMILALMLGVAGFTMVSGLLILILERTQFIGILKALGAPNVKVRRIFLYLAMMIVGKGMLIGNVVGLLLCALQKYTGIIPLDPANYYLDCVPIEFNWPIIITLNVAMLIISVLILIVPSQLISRIYPSKAIQFE